MRTLLPLLFLTAALSIPSLAQRQDFSRPPGYTPTAEEAGELEGLRDQLSTRLKALAESRPERLPDAAVFFRMAERVDQLNLFARKQQVEVLKQALKLGLVRAQEVELGKPSWIDRPGVSLRGYLSQLDRTVQPYGLVLPRAFRLASTSPWRLDVVLHGRGTDELRFIEQFEPATAGKQVEPVEQPAIELHCFGRGNNGWRWAGEADVFEALQDVRRQYRIDPNRINLIGFSMGGHGAWHLGVHRPSDWAIVSAGAGFSETRRYLESQQYAVKVPPYQEAAWHIYDAVDYARNLFNTPFIGYGGEDDRQLAAAKEMKAAADREGAPMTLLIGPKTGHSYHPDSYREIMRRLTRAQRNPRPSAVRFVTWTLRYPRCAWVTIDALEQHYRRASVDALLEANVVNVKTENVTALTLDPLPVGSVAVRVDGQPVEMKPGHPVRVRREKTKWKNVDAPDRSLRKRHGMQGPIDDAFTSHFIAVPGTGKPWRPEVQLYGLGELERFRADWRYGFRGEVLTVADNEIGEQHIRFANLILFGDPGSNKVLARMIKKLPLKWTEKEIRLGKKSWKPGTVPVMVFPNPYNPQRYIVINSGHTWTRADLDGTNALLTPKLPDWAMLNPTGDPREKRPEVLEAGYFDEQWKPLEE